MRKTLLPATLVLVLIATFGLLVGFVPPEPLAEAVDADPLSKAPQTSFTRKH